MEESSGHLIGIRRLSQAIAEGDGISIIVHARDLAVVRAEEEQGAEALVLTRRIDGVRESTSLPLLWTAAGKPNVAAAAGADAWRLVVEDSDHEEGALEAVHAEAAAL